MAQLILVNGSGQIFVNSLGQIVVIPDGGSPQDCPCCGENITVIQAYPCSIGSAGFWGYRTGNPNTLPTVGEIWRIDGDCWTINAVGSAADTGQEEWDPIAGPFEECDACCYTTAYARLIICGGIQQIDFFYTPDPEDLQPCFDHHFTTGVYLYEGQCAVLHNITAAQAVDPIEWPFPPAYGTCEQCQGALSYPYCVTAIHCGTQQSVNFCNQSSIISPPQFGKVYSIGGECYTVNGVSNGITGGFCYDLGFCDSFSVWAPDSGPFNNCEECLPVSPCENCTDISGVETQSFIVTDSTQAGFDGTYSFISYETIAGTCSWVFSNETHTFTINFDGTNWSISGDYPFSITDFGTVTINCVDGFLVGSGFWDTGLGSLNWSIS